MNLKFQFFFISLIISSSVAKKFTLCEFAKEVYMTGEVPFSQLVHHVCVADTRSKFDSSGDLMTNSFLGIYRFGKQWWCGVDVPGGGCNLTCDKLVDNDITDDIKCALETIKRTGTGAWELKDSNCREYSKKIGECTSQWKRELEAI